MAFQNNDAPQGEENKKKLYLGNLPWSMSEDDVRQLCEQFGEIDDDDLKLITDHNTGRSKGFAFVEFATEEEAAKALEELNEQEIEGRKLFVKYARPKQPRDDRGGYRRNNRGYNRGPRDNGGF